MVNNEVQKDVYVDEAQVGIESLEQLSLLQLQQLQLLFITVSRIRQLLLNWKESVEVACQG